MGSSSRIGLRPFLLCSMYQQLSTRTGLAVTVFHGLFSHLEGWLVQVRRRVESIPPLRRREPDVFGEEFFQAISAVNFSQSVMNGVGFGFCSRGELDPVKKRVIYVQRKLHIPLPYTLHTFFQVFSPYFTSIASPLA